MKEEVKVMELDRPEQGAMYTALKDLHDKRVAEGKSTDTVVGLMNDLREAPVKLRRVRGYDAR
jgi:hypothetical protein